MAVKLHIDLETFSKVNLRTRGVYVYAADPSTEIMMAAVAYNDKETVLFDCTREPPPLWLCNDLVDPDIEKLAFNATFEMQLLANCWGLDIQDSQWTDVMVLAKSLSFPGGLGQVGACVGIPLDTQKLTSGKALIKKFCGPKVGTQSKPHVRSTRATDPEAWAEFCTYCIQDVNAEREIYKKLLPFSPETHPASERSLWLLDQHINETGMPVDVDLIDAGIEVYKNHTKSLLAGIKSITGLDNPNSVVQLQSWLQSKGVTLKSLTKAVMRDCLLRPDLPSAVRNVLLLRQEASKVSPKKFQAFKQRSSEDARLRGSFQFYGAARTGRWTGGGVQPHNLVSPTLGGRTVEEIQIRLSAAIKAVKHRDLEILDLMYPSVTDALISTIRCVIAAPAGKSLRVADLSSVETVVIGWLSGSKRITDLFRTGRDAYKDYATEVFSVEYSEVTKDQRKFCKPPVLGCGFGLGGEGLMNYAHGFGVDLSELYEGEKDEWRVPIDPKSDTRDREYTRDEKAMAVGKRLVDVYRSAYPEVPKWWNELRIAAFSAMGGEGAWEAGLVSYEYCKPFLFCRLPSGRSLSYFSPKIETVVHPKFGSVRNLTYEGVDQFTRKWTRLATHPGKMAENIVQAVARDLLAAGMQNSRAAGFEIVGHVHDEIIAMTDTDGGSEIAELIDCMTELPPWAKGMPLGATGWEGAFYLKD
jgi:DNA polymerase